MDSIKKAEDFFQDKYRVTTKWWNDIIKPPK
jgi:hypothetical protein